MNHVFRLHFALFLASLLPVLAHPASVSWDSFSLTGSYDASTRTGSYVLSTQITGPYNEEKHDFDYVLYPLIGFETSRLGITTTLKACAESIMLAYGDNWIQTRQGDVVGPENTTGNVSCFLHGWVSWVSDETSDLVGTSDYNISVSNTDTIYLGFATMSDLNTVSYEGEQTGTRDWMKYYGWVELEVSPTSVTLGHSAIRLDGRPIIVGSTDTPLIPEPATHALALLGAALLLPRRRKLRSIS